MRELLEYLPEGYRNSPEAAALQNALQPEAEGIWAARDSLLAQLDPACASWGLDYWERALGVEGASGLAPELRRRQIAARLQGQGPATVQAVREEARAFLGVDAAVTEAFHAYRVELDVPADYVPGAGLPRLLEHLAQRLPAHLELRVTVHMEAHAARSFRRCGNATTFCGARGLPTEGGVAALTWAGLDALGLSWADWAQETWFSLLYGR